MIDINVGKCMLFLQWLKIHTDVTDYWFVTNDDNVAKQTLLYSRFQHITAQLNSQQHNAMSSDHVRCGYHNLIPVSGLFVMQFGTKFSWCHITAPNKIL